MQLDATDLILLRALQLDARRSNKELAALVNLAPSTTHARIRRLEQEGCLRGSHAVVDESVLGIGVQALIFVRLQSHARSAIQGFWQRVVELEEVVAAFYVGGDDDIVMHVAVRDTQHLRDLVLDRIPGLDDIGRLRTELVFEHQRRPPPLYAGSDDDPKRGLASGS